MEYPFGSRVKTPMKWVEMYPRTQADWADVHAMMAAPPRTPAELADNLEYLWSKYEYDPHTGLLSWAYVHPEDQHRLASRPGPNGRRVVTVGRMTVSTATVVWLMHMGVYPKRELLQRDPKLGDRIENLCEAEAVEGSPLVKQLMGNGWSRRPLSRGVARCGDRWQAYARVNGRQIGLGRFDTEERALDARAQWERTQEARLRAPPDDVSDLV